MQREAGGGAAAQARTRAPPRKRRGWMAQRMKKQTVRDGGGLGPGAARFTFTAGLLGNAALGCKLRPMGQRRVVHEPNKDACSGGVGECVGGVYS